MGKKKKTIKQFTVEKQNADFGNRWIGPVELESLHEYARQYSIATGVAMIVRVETLKEKLEKWSKRGFEFTLFYDDRMTECGWGVTTRYKDGRLVFLDCFGKDYNEAMGRALGYLDQIIPVEQ